MTQIVETLNRLTATEAAGGGRMLVDLITPGWGSSGYYAAETLAEAAKAKVFPAGLHMYLDHPSELEEHDRPERSVRDIAGVLDSDAVVSESGALQATVRVFSTYREVLAEMKDHIGVSIRAMGDAVTGEAEGRSGPIITALTEGISVDFVTHAGRGGKIAALLESTRERPALVEAFGMTANELSNALHDAVTAAHAGGDRYAYVRDYDDEAVIFHAETPEGAGLWRQSYTVADRVATLTGTPAEVVERTQYEPVNPPAELPVGTAPASESEGTNTVVENESTDTARSLTESQNALTEANRRLAYFEAREAAGPIIEAALDAEGAPVLPAPARARVVESVRSNPPLNAELRLDEAALTVAVTAAATREAAYVASIAPAPVAPATPAPSVWGSAASLVAAEETAGTATQETNRALINEAFAFTPRKGN